VESTGRKTANAAQEKQGNEIACSAFKVITSNNESMDASEQTIVITDNHNAVTQDSTNVLYIKDEDLHNYLLDSGATQHMTPRLADLEDVVEGRKLGVEVAEGTSSNAQPQEKIGSI
jgi:hypothetical protein